MVELPIAWKIAETCHILWIPSPYYICQCFDFIQVTYHMTLDSKRLFPWILNGSTWWLTFLQVFVSELSSWYPCWIAQVIHGSRCWYIWWYWFSENMYRIINGQKLWKLHAQLFGVYRYIEMLTHWPLGDSCDTTVTIVSASWMLMTWCLLGPRAYATIMIA